MRQRLALIAVEENDVAGFRLLFSQLQAQADPFDLGGDLAPLRAFLNAGAPVQGYS